MSFIRTPKPSVRVDYPNDGSIRLRSDIALPAVRQSLPHLFDEVTDRAPANIFMRQRAAHGEWREISYGDARRAANGLAQWLIDQGLGVGDAVSFLSEPSIEHGIAAIGIQRSGAAIAPVSVAYSLIAEDFSRLRNCVSIVGAKVVIVSDATRYAKAMRALADLDVRFVAVSGNVEGLDVTPWSEVVATTPTPEVASRMGALTHESISRIMYTSGSTGSPKATPLPQANLVVTVAQVEAVGLLDFDGEQPQFLEAMPFSHIMAGNFNFNNVIAAGGTMWIDDGKPTPELFPRTIANLREVSPHFFITVPLGFSMLCDAMEEDEALRDSFFAKLRFVGFGGALLPDAVRDRLLALSMKSRGAEVPIFNFYGATEFMFGALRYWTGGPSEVIGLPLPSSEIKLVEDGDRMEMRIKGRTMMAPAGYIGEPEATKRLFDEEGFYRTGDAVRFADPDDPSRGLLFAGRLSEDFKLSTGTFVNATALRLDILKRLGALVDEVVLCGVNQDYVGLLAWPSADFDALGGIESLDEKLGLFNAESSGSSRRIGAALLMREPLSFDAGELTDKRNVAARVVRERRASDVARLFAPEPDPAVIHFNRPAMAAPALKE